MKQKKLLFVCHDVLGLYKIIQDGFEKYSDYEITTLIIKKYHYKNKFQRIQNLFYKIFLNKNLKLKWQENELFSPIKSNDIFDLALTVCPEAFNAEMLNHVKKISKKSIVYYWDSFNQFPKNKETLLCFDKHFTFEPQDAINYNLNLLTNFYYQENINLNATTDIYFLSSFDKRFITLDKIVENLIKQKNNLNLNILQFSKNEPESISSNQYIKFIKTPVNAEENLTFIQNSKILLDIHKNIQDGLSFRVFEAMGFRKKLITTNSAIKDYDFYNPNNIFIIEDVNNFNIPLRFFESEYEEIDEEIFKKYHIKSWIENIINS